MSLRARFVVCFRLSVTLFLLVCSSCFAPETPPQPTSSKKPSSHTALNFEKPPSLPDILDGSYQPPPPEDVNEQLSESARGWFYGPGIGRTALNVGTVVVFPPYALYLLGNAGLMLAGYSPLYITDAIPETPRKHVLDTYVGVTDLPGRVTALVGGEEFHNK